MRKQLGRFSLADIWLDLSQRCIISNNEEIKALKIADYKLPPWELSSQIPLDILDMIL